MKRIIFIGTLLMTLGFTAAGQFFYGGMGYSYPRTNFVADSAGNLRFEPGDIGFSMHAGAFASTDFKGNAWYGTTVAPSLAYNLSPRFRVKAGVAVTQGFGNSCYPGYDGYYSPGLYNGTTTSVFVQGDYILNNKLMLSGAVHKYFSPTDFRINDPRFKGPEGEAYMFNINYRPSPHFEINATFEVDRGDRIFRQDPFYRTPFYGF